MRREKGLFDVTGDELGHLKHADLGFAIEHGFEGGVGVDEGLLGGILKLVLLDVVPEFLGEFATGDRGRSDDGGQNFVRLHWLHEGCVWFACSGFISFGHVTALCQNLAFGNKKNVFCFPEALKLSAKTLYS